MPLSDTSLTVSDFDPEHEALASTREIGSPRLPNMHEEADWEVNTSTIDRAFPEFSQIPSEDEIDAEEMFDDNSEPSMELGRGVGKSARRLDDSRDSVMSFQNSVRSSSPAVRVEYPTPQKSLPARSTSRRAVSENLRKDAQLRRANQAQKEHMMSPQVSKNQRDQRRTLSDMHAKVRDNYDGSFLGDERPAPVETKSRSTRFGNVNQSQEIADAIERASQEAYAKEIRKGNPAATRRPVGNATHTNMGDTMTRNSFLLPDLPNISELVSGVYEDGTPVFSHRRSTRFVSPPHDGADVSLTREHMPLDAVPIPEDEKALFVSLRLLQDKVSELEMFKSDAERRLETYREENAALKAGRSRHSEKYAVDDGENRKSSKRAASENQKLEAANLALQNQLDIADRKTQVQEAAVRRLNQERESAISQLGVAYLETRELKTENEALRRENAELKSQLSQTSKKSREQETASSEESLTGSDDDSQSYTERSGDMSRSTRDLTSKSARSNSRARRHDDSRSKISTQVDKEISRLEKERAEEALFSIDVHTTKRSARSSRSAAVRQSESKSSRKQPNTSKQRVKRVVVEDVTEVTEQSKASFQVEDLTLLSIIDENEIARLRKTLEEERLSRKQRRSSATKDTTAETVNTTRQSILKTPMPRKSSLREPKPQIPRPASATGDVTTKSVATSEGENSLVVPTAERPRRHSEHSVTSIPSQRKKRRNIEDMTSAFILPDITLSRVELAASNPTRLPEADQRALDSLAHHEGKNCMVCKNVLPNDTCNHEPVKVTKPVPVSERMPKPSLYNEEPTMRPSQSPAVALATVLKTLEDELSHLKMQLATYQSAYNNLDASLGKRQRKALLEKIETVLRDIDMKSDQIYALYDVLEGQKVGYEMTEREMETTLESIGVDMAAAQDVTGTTNKSSRLADSDDEDELPWEGIESTAELTGRT
ncbi:hypothetical protein N7520_006298 [Penicillium odoratum]|uniref:uncharacterized protein n=1 Tax=Penicillium odoratum TaxID=1167516 RepID=UPI0025466D07|nr:uncharacterized protein N7520_006298 [Penicillium odoratum]KAJ5759142.1 hypothetical protein N7520_006298 [Penicillium odoratum]